MNFYDTKPIDLKEMPTYNRQPGSEIKGAWMDEIQKHKKSVWRLVLLFFILTAVSMAGSILFLKFPKLDRHSFAVAFLFCFAGGAFAMATLVCLKLAIKEVYKSQYGLTTIIAFAFLIGFSSCKKDQAAKSTTECFVCNDANGNELNVICAPTEDSAYNIATQAWPGMTPEQFHNKCTAQ